MIGTRISKIDSKIAEIIEVKVGNHHLEIDIFLLHRGRKIILTSMVSAISKSIFKNFVPKSFSKFPEFFKNVPIFPICMSKRHQKNN